METKNIITLTVGLVIGVLLISGVVAPVIANTTTNSGSSEETYTNTGSMTYSFANENTDIHIYPVAEDKVSFQPESVTDRTVYDLTFEWIDGKSFGVFFHDTYVRGESVDASYFSCKEVDGVPSLIWDGDHDTPISEIVIDGTTFICKSDGAEDFISESDVVCYWDPVSPTHVDVVEKDIINYTITINSSYVRDDSKVLISLYRGEIAGEDNYNTVWDGAINGALDSESVIVGFLDSYDHTYDKTPQCVISNNSLESFTVTVDEIPCTFSATDNETIEGNYSNQIENMVLPITVSGDSSSDSSVISTLLSVIPLLMVVGLVIGTVAIFKMKN